ncbi:MAG: hypothetical protein JWQ73_2163 [Variovorax sp.]|nr:hypothetical protein [Variovorax sp.]
MIDHATQQTDVGAPFWQGLRERRLMLQFDAATGRAQFYPRPQSLYSDTGVEWREATGHGAIAALTLSRVAPAHLAGAVPYVLALVQLVEGPRMLARIAAPYESLVIGQPVSLDWEAAVDPPHFPVFKPA